MPQTIQWTALDGDWSYGLLWWCDAGEAPVLQVQLRAPNGARWSYELVILGAAYPNAPWNAPPTDSIEPSVELQPEAEPQ
jgi:hypothetical protein